MKYRKPIESSPTQERNARCQCGSGKKYKKCCLLKEMEQERMERIANETVALDKPTQEQAARWFVDYVNKRIFAHNATVTHLSQIEAALSILPESEERNFVLRDTTRRLNEIVGDSCDRDTKVLRAMAKIAADVSGLIPQKEEPKETQGGPVVGDVKTPPVSASDDAPPSSELAAELDEELEEIASTNDEKI